MDETLRAFMSTSVLETKCSSLWRFVTGEDWLGFGGVAPPSFPIISAEQQFAEKLHAYTLPRGERVNTRTKDLIDMVLLIREETLAKSKTAAVVRATFMKSATHDVPKELDPPPAEWEPVFDALAKECNLAMQLPEGFELVREFTKTLECKEHVRTSGGGVRLLTAPPVRTTVKAWLPGIRPAWP
jgi:hypothetical protein